MTRTVSSLLDGRPSPGAPGGTLSIANPARLDEIVAEASLGDAGTFVDACRRAHAAQPAWAATPAPVRGRAIQQLGRLVERSRR
jgi:acyl-CoA reductase-like NAD-dependent aldehyde dehydrogenase